MTDLVAEMQALAAANRQRQGKATPSVGPMPDDFPIIASVPTEVFAPKYGDGWFMEPKFDGHRVIVDYRGDTPRFLNRNGQTYGAGPFRVPIPESWKGYVIDGEYMPTRGGLSNASASGEAAYHFFDVLKIPSDDAIVYGRPLFARRNLLPEVPHDANDIFRITCLLSNESDLAHWRENWKFIDGVVFKKRGSIYVPGKSNSWLKYKFVSDIDVYVTALAIDDKSNCELSIWDPLSDTEFKVGKASTSGKSVKLGDVVTVRFLKLTEAGRLREPRIVDVRSDKAQKDCTIDQLIPFMPNT